MAESSKPSLRWLYLAVLAPLVLLAGLAWYGTQSQLKAAWAEATTQAEASLPRMLEETRLSIEESLVSVVEYPDPPIPGEPSTADEILDGTDLEALVRLRDDPDAGISPAGLPRRALAALRIQHLDGERKWQSLNQLSQILTREAPSVLTDSYIKKHFLPDSLTDWEERQALQKSAKSLKTGEEIWLSKPQRFFVRKTAKGFSYARLSVPPSVEGINPTPGFQAGSSMVTVWREPFAPLSAFPLLARQDLPLGSGVSLFIQARPDLLEARVHRERAWTFALLAFALITAIVSLYIIHRTVARERHLAELKSQFVASVSHELRAPLGSIRLMAEALQQEKVRKPAEFHTLIAKEGARLSHLIENVLDFARIEEGRKYYHFEECDLSALLRDTLRLMQPLAEERRVHLAFDIPDLTATVDPNALQQALVNLVDNAIKFSPEGSSVDLRSTNAKDGQIEIRITDHGPGIAKSEHKDIFNRFHRLGNELRRETQGTGIGLSIVKHIAEAHGGTITVASTPPKGSSFILTLPQHHYSADH